MSVDRGPILAASLLLYALGAALLAGAEVLNPPYFNLAEGRKIVASATCGEGVPEPELYCKLVGAKVCDYCDPNDPKRAHPAEYAIDGTEKFWISPPLSRGSKYNEVNLTIDLGQEFHVAYVFIKMGNSPRPGVWILERSKDNGRTYTPLEYFADTPGDCVEHFGADTLQPITRDDSVICETKFSKVVPLEGGEIVVSLLNERPNADNFSYSTVLQEFTKATNLRLRFIRTKTLLGHLMSVARQDPTVTRRYFYSIKDINIGGRCVCNGHAETCDLTDPREPYKLLCRCKHNTCGSKCEECCPGYKQKKWRRAIIDAPFVCEPCNCFGHSDECIYDEEVDLKRLSLDIHGHYEGGGVCQNCRHNTRGINCNECRPTYYRPFGKLLNDTDVCQPCNCDPSFSTGNCADGTGLCECRAEFLPPYCDDCNVGYYGYPECKLCDCHASGTNGNVCEVGGGQCPCKPNYGGQNCDRCKEGYYGFPDCLPCNCNPSTSVRSECDESDGQCFCKGNYGGRQCDRCRVGYYDYPACQYCSCDPTGCLDEICDSLSGECLCKEGHGGPRCDRCAPGFFGYPECRVCGCDEQGSRSSVCDFNGRCDCLSKFGGPKCDVCSPGHYDFPNCHACNCEPTGSIGVSCSDVGQCVCKENFDGEKCDFCKEGFYNYPYCEECNCNPAGVLATFLGCGSVEASGKLCECKERVTGRICDTCRPLYWNLQLGNPQGCQDCDCFSGGTVGGLSECEGGGGQCRCKPNVASRQCGVCRDGAYELDSDDLFGCKDCGCDIGGSVNNACDKESGQCACRPRISGRRCDRPLETHYFPTLFQLQYEVEDGRTPGGTDVRYGHDSGLFPGFSWKGYAIFKDLQKEVILDIFVEKPSLYQVLFNYLNFGGENIYGTVTFSSDFFGDIQQSSDMVFETTTSPRLMKVSGKEGLVASPFVLNPGRWSVIIRIEKPMFLDYMVLLPQSYYEGTLLQEDVSTPCGLQKEDLCRHFRYPSLPQDALVVRGEAGYAQSKGEDQPRRTNLYEDTRVLEVLETDRMAWLDETQENLHLDYDVTTSGPYVMIITYHTPTESGQGTRATIEVTSNGQPKDNRGSATFYECGYSFPCRQVVIDQYGQVAMFELEPERAGAVIELEEEGPLAIDSVALVPAYLWTMDYITPKSVCVKHDGVCTESEYTVLPESVKIEFESEVYPKTTDLPVDIAIDPDVGLVNLDEQDNVVDVEGAVPTPGLYIFVVHYYQPNHPTVEATVTIQDGDFHEGVFPAAYCPSVSGCRAKIGKGSAKDPDPTGGAFNIKQNFYLSIKQPANKTLLVDYLLAIPANQYQESVLQPLPEDKASKFIAECGANSFLLSPDAAGFCREAAFSLTSEFNNGALPCQCDTDGSLSYECAEFGGQCQCRPNVIGRTCSQCRTGFFGFPNCKVCDCPSLAFCHPVTGQCICPPRVTGSRCDTCVPYTFGFDPIIGCEKCNCNPLGVLNGDLQCNVETGECRCKANIVGRTCDKCKSGYWAFPHCQLCNCDLRGTKEDICHPDTARCDCKEQVHGESCDSCKPGTFFLEEANPLGCTKCFCFGTTDRCSSGYLFRRPLIVMDGWSKSVLDTENELAELPDNDVELVDGGREIQARLPGEWSSGKLFYFSAPRDYLGNQLSSYGGNLSYSLYALIDQDEDYVESYVGPDIILMGNNITLVHDSVEQPVSGVPYRVNVNLIEHEFHLTSGRDVSREQMMMVLVKLEKVLIRGSYFHPVQDLRLSDVTMDIAVEQPHGNSPEALRVEQCHCPPNYRGNSCEECAPGYYRSKTGPYLGYCVPCECNGHADACDVITGICIGCRDNSVGDHCEKCAAGYHGDSTVGTPYDCLICACPLPIESNNFATSCEVSPTGDEISCECKPGYYGNRCEACDLGFFGSPETLGSECRPCQCSGNIDPTRPGSCDSVSGECILCLNNTHGQACELCRPGFYGDAIHHKNCRKCDCDECGTVQCNHQTGVCECWPNTEYPRCDSCIENHWGFASCRGCRPCNCGPASRGPGCDLETGQCDCQPGAGGLTCDLCEPGYWQYSPAGCISCNCDEKYSAGAVCNPISGQCECLPGVLGDKCDSCPHRWVFVKNQGCHACDPCVHSLLDTTDALRATIDPVMDEMKDVSLSYFANKRLQNVNWTADTLRLAVDQLFVDPDDVDYNPLEYEVLQLEKTRDRLDRNASHLHNQAETINADADNTRIEALEVEALIRDTVGKVKDIVDELGKLSEGLRDSLGPNVERLLAEAERTLDGLRDRSFEGPKNATGNEYEAAEELLDNVKTFEVPFLDNKMKYEAENGRIAKLQDLLDDLAKKSANSSEIAEGATLIEEQIQNIPLKKVIGQIEDDVDDTNGVLQNATDLLDKAKDFLNSAENSHRTLDLDADRLQLGIRDLADKIDENKEMIAEIRPVTEEAERHADFLKEQAAILDRSLADTRDSADAAVKAANAYADIEEAINDAYLAAEAALDAAEQASEMSEGVLDKVDASKDKTNQQLDSAFLLEQQVGELEPQLEMAKDGVLLVAQQNAKNSRGLDIIKKELEKLPLYSVDALAGHAANGSALADDMAARAKGRMEALGDRLPEDLERAKRLPKDIDDTKQAIKAAHSYADRVASIVPDTNRHMDGASKKESGMRIIGTDVADKIRRLEKQVAVARNAVKRIKLGVQFFDNSTLQLRNPDSMAEKAATHTSLSMYFKTTERYGLLAFVGNEKGTHNQMKRVLTDDYMALEIRGGNIVLLMDLGSGFQDIRHSSYVSDERWHQVIVERTGKTCILTVRTEDEEDVVVEGFLPGTFSVFNLNQKLSKFFIGGVPNDVQLPDTVTNLRFDGCIEGVEFGGTPVGLWDFVRADNVYEGCAERDQLEEEVPSNGLKFSGSGYVILPKKKHQFGPNTHVKIPFKTYAKDGLLFLIGKNNKFFAIELQDGHPVLRYNLGSGTVTLALPGTYNDGEWHHLEATRTEDEGILKIGDDVAEAKNPGPDKVLSTTNQIFVGGHPSGHNFPGVTNKGFEGCIQDMQIFSEVIDLNKNKEALGVVNGCPVSIARTISFGNETSSGYIAMPAANLEKFAELTFKFKTTEPDALLFYAANDDQSNHLLIALRDGQLVMSALPGGQIGTHPDVRYNDKEWHYVTATKAVRQMRLDIDDINSVEIELPVEAAIRTTTPAYFGGVPEAYDLIAGDVFPNYRPFLGCLGDTTVNGKFQNFADSRDAKGASLATCPLADVEEEEAPMLPTAATEVTEEYEAPGPTTPTPTEDEDEDVDSTDFPPGPEPTPYGQCALPVPPRVDTSVKPGDGTRFGNTPHSRQEFVRPGAFMGSLVDDSTFALEFKTSLPGSGVLFYVSAANHKDFVGLLMQKGKIAYVFNCGTGSAVIITQKAYNDGTWHRVVFSRQGKEGRLVVDDEEEVRGSSQGSASSVNVAAPFYVGGLNETAHREAKNNLKGINLSFPGCIRNVEAQGELLTSRKPSVAQNVSGCSDMVEEGTYFSNEGGYLVLYDKYNVGQKISISFDIKPRNLSGVLLAVHGQKDYLILQLVDGKIVLGVDNGAGPIRASYEPSDPHTLCDGQWHTVQVVKNNNIVSVALDGTFSEPGIGVGGVSSTDTKDPLYVGGLPGASLSKRGVETRDQFVGCMRFLELKNKPQSFAQTRVFGQVTLNTCSTI